MADYIYLLENRLSADQQNALRQLREAAREAGILLFLTGDAVRDLTSGHAVRDLEVVVHGNALKLKKIIEKLGGKIWGESETSKTLYLCFPGTVRVDLISAHRTEYPKPGKPIYHPDSIQEDLRRRDFTVNAMAISLNEGSFGLLMDPMNGVADIEARTLRLVSNYGFLEEPSLLIRATRYMARLGWELDPKTKTRYDNAIAEDVIEHLSAESRSEELEQIGHEEDGLKVLRALEADGWMKVLCPAWTAAKADEEKLATLHALAVELLLQGVRPDMSAAQMQLLTAKLAPKDLSALKKSLLRPGFVEEWNSLDSLAAGFAKVLLAKENSTPSTSFKLFTTYDPEAILWLGFTTKDAAVKERFEQFLKIWPEARQRIPHALMQEMRITPELATYPTIVHAIFLELIDGRLTTPEEIRAFLEPHSPPAPPPQVTIKRPRAKRGAEPKVKEAAYDDDEDSESDLEDDDELEDIVADDEEIDLGIAIPKVELDSELADDGEHAEDETDSDDEEAEPVSPKGKRGAKAPAPPKPVKQAKPSAKPVTPAVHVQAQKPAPPFVASVPAKVVKTPPIPAPKIQQKPVPALKSATEPAKPKPAPTKSKPAPAVKKATHAPVPSKGSKATKPAVPTPRKPVAKAPAKPPVKAPAKPAVKVPVKVKSAQKSAPAKAKAKPAPAASKAKKPSHPPKPAKPAAKKPAPKPAKKR